MAILHKNITNSADIHNPKWHPDANNGDYAWRNEKGELESLDELLLPAALNFVDGSVAPPTSNTNDIYILSSGGSVNAGWGSVSLQDWVRYDGSVWYAITPQKSSLCYDKTADSLMSFDGTAWAAIGGGGGTDVNAVHVNVASEISGITAKATPTSSDLLIIEDAADSNNKKKITIGDLPSSGGGNTIYSANDSLTGDRVVNLDSNKLEFKDSTNANSLLILDDNTRATISNTVSGIISQYQGSSTTGKLSIFSSSVVVNASQFQSKNQSGSHTALDITNDSTNGKISINNSVGTQIKWSTHSVNLTGAAIQIIRNSQAKAYFTNTFTIFGSNSTTTVAGEDISLQGETVIQGVGTGTGTTLALYDSDSPSPNKNAEFKDNGNVSFYNLPTSASGLSAGDIYNDGGTLKIV